MKSMPVAVIVVAVVVPAGIEVGLSAVIVGPLTVNVRAAEEAALEFWTVTFCGPAEASWVLVTAAVSEVALPYVVVSGVVPHIAVEPPLTKFVPVTLSVKGAPPATAEVGFSDVIAGPTTLRVEVDDVAPPGLCTVRLSLPVLATMLAGMVAVMDVAVPAVTANAVVPA